MNIFAPDKISLLSESPEGNCAEHYAFRRDWDRAYWAAIYFAYDLSKRGVANSNRMAYEEFSNEVSFMPSCH